MAVCYEWGVEMHEFNGEDFDTDHFQKWSDGDPWQIVLIRDEGSIDVGVLDRTWAYVRDGVLDSHFCDGINEPCYDVPKRFIREVAAVHKQAKTTGAN